MIVAAQPRPQLLHLDGAGKPARCDSRPSVASGRGGRPQSRSAALGRRAAQDRPHWPLAATAPSRRPALRGFGRRV
jgi:hypothetical protein